MPTSKPHYALPTALSASPGRTSSRCLPRDAGASLPQVQRYTDWRYRDVARAGLVHAKPENQLEAVALMRLLPERLVQKLFLWTPFSLGVARALAKRWENSPTVAAAHRANIEALDLGCVLGLVQTLHEHGWEPKGKPLPDLIKLSLRAARDEGYTIAEISDMFGIPYWTVSYAFRVPHGKRMATKKKGLVL